MNEWIDQATEAREDELGAELGDPRRCPLHPHVKTSSPDGMFDAPCDECEHAYDAIEEQCAWDALTDEERARFNAEEDAREAHKDNFIDDTIPF